MKLLDIPFEGLTVPISLIHGDLYYADDGRVFIFRNRQWEVLFPVIEEGNERICMCPDGNWRDTSGTIWALREDGVFTDSDPRCGKAPLTINRYADGCAAHDFAYNSPTYQEFHTRKEADQNLKKHLLMVGAPKVVANLFYWIVRRVGGFFWENDKTK